jgi:hypothetical protein
MTGAYQVSYITFWKFDIPVGRSNTANLTMLQKQSAKKGVGVKVSFYRRIKLNAWPGLVDFIFQSIILII